ncbi:acetyltransferase [Phytopseudomonas punonensis]|uniref:Sugar O-acyltransferase, sialic acid O-acetyltransferase NeuD family n=1 Tax=Phytopseudomonas punonensis TaxID=1220495 RepID=A0A1M7M4B0_9GAMM|nr:acetyltransferase [Pseudomonas punonensis]SHM85406.1 sugar O-acyltransferase, sialic acid O-acetyltransferase NeuD family [Pseudomonas punonensis]
MSESILLILGAGGHGRAVAEAALLSGQWQSVRFLDDRWPELSELCGIAVVGKPDDLAANAGIGRAAIAAVGNNTLREKWSQMIEAADVPLATVVHPRAFVSADAEVGRGVAVMAMAMVGVGAIIGRGAIVNANATVDHDAILGAFAHLGVGVQLAGGVKVGRRAWLQAGCSAGYHVVIEDGALLSPGTVLKS